MGRFSLSFRSFQKNIKAINQHTASPTIFKYQSADQNRDKGLSPGKYKDTEGHPYSPKLPENDQKPTAKRRGTERDNTLQ